ncbi:hypothetical protein CAEBREN_16715 [Caenorhabditis brenneri]|uniref:Sdz-33 F-box domain-containing protein n=1 Tax=Caenorhabditis brenneri TaxID=135651 RepID=G0MR17_CAEBE|nr:hypothetical protein CAEBREN_16715 [Caenorhabditis brenneri]
MADYGVCFTNRKFIWVYTLTSNESEDDKITTKGEKVEELRKYTDNKLESLKKICCCIREIFGFDFDCFDFHMEQDSHQNRLITDWLKSVQESVRGAGLHSYERNQNNLKYFLKNVKITKLLEISPIVNENCHIDLPQNLEYLSIKNVNFVKLGQILKMNCKNIILENTNLTNHDAFVFLKKWISMKWNLNLEYFQIGVDSPSISAILQDLPYIFGDDWRFEERDIVNRILNHDKKIIRKDGKIAQLFFRREFSKMVMEMHVQ